MPRVKRHTREFKEQAIALANGSAKSVRSVALSLGVRPQTLEYGIDPSPQDRVAARAAALADQNTDNSVALKLQLNEARAQIRELEMEMEKEKDILKKATAFFAKGSR